MYETLGKDYLSSYSIMMITDCMAYMKLQAVVAMQVRVWCFPLAENQFRNAIIANYYQNTPSVPG